MVVAEARDFSDEAAEVLGAFKSKRDGVGCPSSERANETHNASATEPRVVDGKKGPVVGTEEAEEGTTTMGDADTREDTTKGTGEDGGVFATVVLL